LTGARGKARPPPPFELVINLNTAKALGPTISSQLQFLANGLIE
jgi:hypothetical protein